MTLREFLNTTENDWEAVRIYLSKEDWDDLDTDLEYRYMGQIPSMYLKSTIDAWILDVNFVIHVLV